MKYIFHPIKDATITNAYSDITTTRSIYANMGGSDVMDVFVLYNTASDEYELSRFLIQFDLEKILNKIKFRHDLAEYRVFLSLYNTPHSHTVPREFELEFYRLSHEWEEGIGLDMEQYSDEGGVSWKAYYTVPKVRPRPTTYDWITPGGDFDTSSKKTFYFHEGVEDCRIDITDWFLQWTDPINPYPNYGIIVKFPNNVETSLQKNFYIKKFFARKSQFFYKRPSLEVCVKDTVYTNLNYERQHFVLDSDLYPQEVNYLYYFNTSPHGGYVDIPGYETNDKKLFVKIYDSQNTVVTTIQPIRVAQGVYRYSLNVHEKDVSGNVLFDAWYLNEDDENAFYVGKINVNRTQKNDYSSFPKPVLPKLYIKNTKPYYYNGEFVVFNVYAYDSAWNPNVYVTYYRDERGKGIELKNTFYKIVRKIDETVVVDYSCLDELCSVPYTKIFYNGEYNYFFVDFSIFEPGFMYEIRFMSILDDGSQIEHPESFKFRVDEKRSFRF